LKKNHIRIWQRALFALGLSLCLTGAFLMVNGSIFGDRTTGIAIVTGIVGIGLISTFTTKSTLKNTTKSPEKIITSAKRWQP
jgi:hypothetical protein